MQLDRYAPWEHYPKTLKQSEISNPLAVVDEFFQAGSVTTHMNDILEWRSFVVSDSYYIHDIHGPGNLLYTYDLNLKALEAAYLLLIAYENDAWKRKELTNSILDKEKADWEYFPTSLSSEELLNPYAAVKKIFRNIGPQLYRDYLHEWLHAALYTSPISEDITPGEVITVYDNLHVLYSALWLIHKREGAGE